MLCISDSFAFERNVPSVKKKIANRAKAKIVKKKKRQALFSYLHADSTGDLIWVEGKLMVLITNIASIFLDKVVSLPNVIVLPFWWILS